MQLLGKPKPQVVERWDLAPRFPKVSVMFCFHMGCQMQSMLATNIVYCQEAVEAMGLGGSETRSVKSGFGEDVVTVTISRMISKAYEGLGTGVVAKSGEVDRSALQHLLMRSPDPLKLEVDRKALWEVLQYPLLEARNEEAVMKAKQHMEPSVDNWLEVLILGLVASHTVPEVAFGAELG